MVVVVRVLVVWSAGLVCRVFFHAELAGLGDAMRCGAVRCVVADWIGWAGDDRQMLDVARSGWAGE